MIFKLELLHNSSVNDIVSYTRDEAKFIPICNGNRDPVNKLGTKLASFNLMPIRFTQQNYS